MGQETMTAIFIPGRTTSMPKIARPFALSGVSTRRGLCPIKRKFSGEVSCNASGAGAGSSAAASASAP
jgi:hypothetical protein